MPELPSDPEKLLHFHMYRASATTLTSVYDFLSNILTFQIDEWWPVESSEYKAVANVLESVKTAVAVKHDDMLAKSQEFLD